MKVFKTIQPHGKIVDHRDQGDLQLVYHRNFMVHLVFGKGRKRGPNTAVADLVLDTFNMKQARRKQV